MDEKDVYLCEKSISIMGGFTSLADYEKALDQSIAKINKMNGKLITVALHPAGVLIIYKLLKNLKD